MAVGTIDLTVEQGATFFQQVTWSDAAGNPINVTDYKARLHIRESHKAEDVLIELSSEKTSSRRPAEPPVPPVPAGQPAGITLGGPTGTVGITISAKQTDSLTVPKGVYDLEMQAPDGVVTRLLEGKVAIKPAVTH